MCTDAHHPNATLTSEEALVSTAPEADAPSVPPPAQAPPVDLASAGATFAGEPAAGEAAPPVPPSGTAPCSCPGECPGGRRFDELLARLARLNELEVTNKALAEECRALHARDHEMNVLNPLFMMQIGLRDQLQGLKRSLLVNEQRPAHLTTRESLVREQTVRGIDSCITYIENTLAHFGVHKYHTSARRFDPKTQIRGEDVCTKLPADHGLIADRLTPGYRRNGEILRPEVVRVFVFHKE
jgi:molecular chaperone GrpE (heat shock protein)